MPKECWIPLRSCSASTCSQPVSTFHQNTGNEVTPNAHSIARLCRLKRKCRCGFDQQRNSATPTNWTALMNFARKPMPMASPSSTQYRIFPVSKADHDRLAHTVQHNTLNG